MPLHAGFVIARNGDIRQFIFELIVTDVEILPLPVGKAILHRVPGLHDVENIPLVLFVHDPAPHALQRVGIVAVGHALRVRKPNNGKRRRRGRVRRRRALNRGDWRMPGEHPTLRCRRRRDSCARRLFAYHRNCVRIHSLLPAIQNGGPGRT
ncbi:hypothetical protein SDC9_117289 [bioreactor metagenome]|uniref:Uncharacterized protein n=1 Tax=bioreactor metagenome TaxID=1076179 RepID=A0A645C856_9ZZZZ